MKHGDLATTFKQFLSNKQARKSDPNKKLRGRVITMCYYNETKNFSFDVTFVPKASRKAAISN